ncbi:MAG: hypothetical protein ACRYFX_19020 [Janthinobacterium lividum]
MSATRQCATCAYRGKFTAAPADVQQMHRDFMNDGETDGPHGCHERAGTACVGCARWFAEAQSLAPLVAPARSEVQQQGTGSQHGTNDNTADNKERMHRKWV